MGAESSALLNLQDPAWTFPSGLTIHPAQLRDGRLCSVFIYQPENQDKVNKAAKHLKTLRHPCLLRFLSCTVDVDGIHLVTERIQPLEMVLDSLSSDEICAGIYDVLQALVFLHDKGNSAHNNVCLSSIFVSEDGHWKLGGMEMVSKLTETAPEFAEFGIMLQFDGHARDAYSFGKMVETLLTYVTDKASADLVARFMCTLNSTLLNPDPACRPHLSTLLTNEFFRNDFVEVVNFLKHLTVKTEDEKNEFFKFLLDRVSGLSEELIVSRLVPLLLNQLVFAEPVAIKSFLPHLLRPRKDGSERRHSHRLLSPDLYKARVIPQLLKLFTVHEEHVRMVLLTHIDAYGELFSKEELKNEILPQVMLGLQDINNSMVAMTLHSLAVLVSLLGPEVVIGGSRTKIFKCTAPSFTKTADTTPEDSPAHMNHIMQINQPVKHSFVNVLSNTALSEDELVIIKASQEEEETLTSFSKETNFEPVFQIAMNAVSSDPEMLVSGKNFLSNSVLPAEEWPDWNESEDLRSESSIMIHTLADDDGLSVGLHSKNNNAPIEPCDESEYSSKDLTLGFDTSGVKELGTAPSLFIICPETMHPSSSTANCEVKLKDSHDYQHEDEQSNRNDQKMSKITLEKAVEKKYCSEFGLGEEFTIQVKRKSHDPELDLFADMVPEIKSVTTSFILPTILDSEEELSSKGDRKEGINVPDLPFSSKFAATDVTETGAEGWGVADLNWDEEENLW